MQSLLFDICINSTSAVKCKYFLNKNLTGNTSVSLAFTNKKVFRYSNDWLYLIDNRENLIYKDMETLFIKNRYKVPEISVNGNSVLVSTPFSSGTAHGYAGVLDIIHGIYTSNIKYDRVVLHENTQRGIVDIIKCCFPDHMLYFIKADTVYSFDSLTMIPVTIHAYLFKDNLELNHLYKNIMPLLDNIFFKDCIDCSNNTDLCVLKSSKSSNLTAVGVFNQTDIEIFCYLNNLTPVEPTDYSEDAYARLIHSAKTIVFSWGSTFSKGAVYISDRCTEIIVLVHKEFMTQFTDARENIGHSLKNANITYVPVTDISFVI